VRQLITEEIDLINAMLKAHGIQARTKSKLTLCVKSSFIAYGLQVAPGESVKRIEAISRELSNELTRQRVRLLRGYSGRAVARVRDYPLAIELPHPQPTPLSWATASLRMARHVALVGRSYSYTGAKEEYIDLERHHHTLVAAMSGGGKSTLMRMALLTLAFNTSPADLRIILIDLKNDDLTPFRSLPHVLEFAGDIDSAATAIDYVHQVKTERIATQDKPHRLLLVIDELAELGADKEAMRQLGSILSTGRSLGINCWAGTQYPTAATIGSVVNASFTVRLVGMVDSKQAAHTASKRAGSGAELLQTPGDFLRIDGTDMQRMKAYNISQEDTTHFIQRTLGRWASSYQPAMTLAIASYSQSTHPLPSGAKHQTPVASDDSHFPVKSGRALTGVEAQAVRRMAEAGQFDYRGQFSLNRAMTLVYGSRSPERAQWIREALAKVSV
jgi:DNA segregation ATPase FtsK/SpoIIIE-like protein